MIAFKSLSSFTTEDKPVCFVVFNPIRSDEHAWCYNYDFLRGAHVMIDGNHYIVKDIEMFMYNGQRRANDTISLCVENY